jgi:hypothetical protein
MQRSPFTRRLLIQSRGYKVDTTKPKHASPIMAYIKKRDTSFVMEVTIIIVPSEGIKTVAIKIKTATNKL